MAQYEASIKFQCPICQSTVSTDVVVPETYWSGDNSDERFVEDDTDADCENCNTGFTLHVQNSDGYIIATVYDHAEVDVECSNAFMTEPDPPDYDYEYDDLDVPEQPAENMTSTLDDVRMVLERKNPFFYTSTVNRMVFIQQFAALEAYLADTLIGQIIEKRTLLVKALDTIEELKAVKLPLAEILGDPDIVKRTVATHLRDLMYHNFKKVGSIYRKTLGFDLFPNEDVKERMFKALPLRHDCVHRNGKDKEGNARWEVNEAFVRQVEADMRAVVQHIEAELKKLSE